MVKNLAELDLIPRSMILLNLEIAANLMPSDGQVCDQESPNERTDSSG